MHYSNDSSTTTKFMERNNMDILNKCSSTLPKSKQTYHKYIGKKKKSTIGSFKNNDTISIQDQGQNISRHNKISTADAFVANSSSAIFKSQEGLRSNQVMRPNHSQLYKKDQSVYNAPYTGATAPGGAFDFQENTTEYSRRNDFWNEQMKNKRNSSHQNYNILPLHEESSNNPLNNQFKKTKNNIGKKIKNNKQIGKSKVSGHIVLASGSSAINIGHNNVAVSQKRLTSLPRINPNQFKASQNPLWIETNDENDIYANGNNLK